MGCVYLATSPSEKCYVGLTTMELATRWYHHVWAAHNSQQCSHYPFYRAIRKYGAESITLEVLHESDDLQELTRLERHEIEARGTFTGGYNQTMGGEGAQLSDETRAHLSEIGKALWEDPDYRAKQEATRSTEEHRRAKSESIRKSHSRPEFRKGASKRLKERFQDPEYKQRHLATMRTPEYKAKISAASKRSWSDPEIRGKIVSSLREAVTTDEHRAKVSRNSKEVWKNPERKALHREQMEALWADPEHRENTSLKIREAWADPELRKEQSVRSKEMWADPEFRKARSELMAEIGNDPEERERRKKRMLDWWSKPANRQKRTEETREGWRSRSRIIITVDGETFYTYSDAGRATNVSGVTVKNRCLSDKWPTWTLREKTDG